MNDIRINRLTYDNKRASYSLEDYIRIVKEFHGSLAPGLLIGGFMVDLALKNLPDGEFFDAISETKTCLPDAIQLLTPCTISNSWLKIMDFSRYAICLYDKSTGEGIRVYIDPSKMEQWPEIKNWFYKLKTKKEQNYQLLMDQIREAGAGLCSMKKVKMKTELLGGKTSGSRVVNCNKCGEAFKMKDDPLCPACGGGDPYMNQ
ncbi:MAG: tRNA CCA-pyrophosphorylase [Spirochaetes bacterium]|jgi:formylmethanofuran dehydrogenase subunit E|nr:tRNA CCA-pyrophosphorylase [Spirochaetota bacterium]